MVAVPHELGLVGAILLLVGSLLGLGFAVALWLQLRPASRTGVAAAGLLALAAASAVAVAPWNAWRVYVDLRYSAALPTDVAEAQPVYDHGIDGRIYGALKDAIAPGETFFVKATREVADDSAPLVFEIWPLTTLLPRLAVDDPARADWIVTWGLDPASFGVRLQSVRVLAAERDGFPAMYLARVA
jgi:hypothetical protein